MLWSQPDYDWLAPPVVDEVNRVVIGGGRHQLRAYDLDTGGVAVVATICRTTARSAAHPAIGSVPGILSESNVHCSRSRTSPSGMPSFKLSI